MVRHGPYWNLPRYIRSTILNLILCIFRAIGNIRIGILWVTSSRCVGNPVIQYKVRITQNLVEWSHILIIFMLQHVSAIYVAIIRYSHIAYKMFFFFVLRRGLRFAHSCALVWSQLNSLSNNYQQIFNYGQRDFSLALYRVMTPLNPNIPLNIWITVVTIYTTYYAIKQIYILPADNLYSPSK
jgi:hypothetical protein